jgi:PEP-CTERM motif
MNFKSLAVSTAIAALGATSAHAVSVTDFDGGDHGSFKFAVEAPAAMGFDSYAFTLGGAFDVTTTFAASGIVGSVGLYKADNTLIDSWGVGAPSFSASDTNSLTAGSYYYLVAAFKPGSYTLTSTAVATPVPEPETYAMLAAGLGIVGFVASRRRRND